MIVIGEPGIVRTALTDQLATYVAMRVPVRRCTAPASYKGSSAFLPCLAFVEAPRCYVLDRDPDSLRSELGTEAAYVARIVSEVPERSRSHSPGTVRPLGPW